MSHVSILRHGFASSSKTRAHVWLYLRAAASPIVAAGIISKPRTSAPLCNPAFSETAAGSTRFTKLIASPTTSGATLPSRAATIACGVIAISVRPATTARTIRRAAAAALVEIPGRFAARLNHRYSRAASPVNCALKCDPVRINPGHTVST